MSFYEGKNVLVTGGTGLIGRSLSNLLVEEGAQVRAASLDNPTRIPDGVKFMRLDLTKFENCMSACEGMDYVFHLAGIKGNPKVALEKPASFFVPTILFNTNMMEAARKQGVGNYLYTSTVGVYSPAEVFHEDDVWKSFPSENDKFAGWAKRMGELQAEAYKIEYGFNTSIIRPANVYGPFDTFDKINSTAMASIIKMAVGGQNPLVIWGDGTQIRDFVYTSDVARGMMLAMEKGIGPEFPINLGSGTGHTIRELVGIVVDNLDNKPEIVWDTSKPAGDKKRLMDISRAKSIGWSPLISFEEGIRRTVDWYRQNRDIQQNRYSPFEGK
jgi:GDP-L-fucose synthase